MRDRQTCIGCGKKSPETETNYTLISAQFGWRLTRYRNSDGTIVIEWRCPACWRDYKKAKGGEVEKIDSGRGSVPDSNVTTPRSTPSRPTDTPRSIAAVQPPRDSPVPKRR
jgi:hypothetical protein